MDEVVNLNRFRKRKRRETELREAERNRIVHGQTKAEKRALRRERERVEKAHSAHQREHDPKPTLNPPIGFDQASDQAADPAADQGPDSGPAQDET